MLSRMSWDDSEPLFIPEGSSYLPTDATRSPWGPDSLHGGAPGALLVRAIEQHEPDPPMRVVRVSADIYRPVPVAPLHVVVRTVRTGRRVSVVEAVVTVDDRPVMRTTALRIRDADVPLPGFVVMPPDPAPPGQPEDCSPPALDWPYQAFHTTGCEVRYARGAWNQAGPAFAWIRLLRPVVPGEEPSPMQRVAAAADFGNGVSATLPLKNWLFINPELTVHIDRDAVGPWIGLDAATHLGARGAGTAACRLYDTHGPIGRSAQSLLVEALTSQGASAASR
jgi:hypothetical protein